MSASRLAAIVALLPLLAPVAGAGAGAPQSAPARTMSRFTNPNRQAQLATAFPEIDRLIREFALRSRVPGMAYGVLVDGQLVHTGAEGVRDLNSKVPVDADTVFRIASMTKSFTAVAILRLRDEGRLSLDDPAERYVPELASLAYPTSDSPRVTIRHLLSHAEGFPEDNPWGDRQLAATDDEMARMMRQGIPFSTAPGTAYEYSNFGFAILGRIVARVSGVPYAEYVSRHILAPLGMTSTTLEPRSVPPDRLARGYRLEGGAWHEEPPLPDGAFGSMGGMLTSTRDLAKYVGFLMSAWPPRDGPETGPIRRSSAREMQQVWRPAPAVVSRETLEAPYRLNVGGYGFGLRVSQTCGISHLVAHSGGLPGFGSHMRWLPEHGVAIIAMGSLTYTSWGRVMDAAVEALARTGALQPRVPEPSPALLAARDSVNRLVAAWDEKLADDLAADNLFLDRSKAARQKEFENLRASLGVCAPPGELDVENALRGRWQLACERGTLAVTVTLAPTEPPRVQHLEAEAVLPLGPELGPAVTRVAALIGVAEAPAVTLQPAGEGRTVLRAGPRPAAESLAAILAPTVDAAAVGRQLAAASTMGTCVVGDVIEGGGDESARVRLACARGALSLTVRRDRDSGRLALLRIEALGGRTCPQ